MATVAVEAFTDPYSPCCWAAQPTLRRLRYEFDDVEWTPRLTVLLPTAADADDERLMGWREAAGATGMPVADDPWPDGLPTTRTACEAVAFVRETAPTRALPVLRRLRVAAYAEGRALGTAADVATVAGAVDGVAADAIRRGLRDGRAGDALAADLDRAVAVAEARSTVETRGTIERLSATERGVATDPDQDDETEPSLVGPPTLRVERGSTVILCDARLPYGRLATAFGRSTPTTGVTVDDKFAISRMAMHVPREVAESLSAQDFAGEVEPYLRRFGRAYLPEIAAATGRSPETCVEALEELVARGDAARLGPREWRTVHGPGHRGGDA